MGNEIVGVFGGQTAYLPIAGTGPVDVTISIYGPGGAYGYNPLGSALLEYFDPVRGEQAHQTIPIGGGYTASVTSVTVGSIISTEQWMGG